VSCRAGWKASGREQPLEAASSGRIRFLEVKALVGEKIVVIDKGKARRLGEIYENLAKEEESTRRLRLEMTK